MDFLETLQLQRASLVPLAVLLVLLVLAHALLAQLDTILVVQPAYYHVQLASMLIHHHLHASHALILILIVLHALMVAHALPVVQVTMWHQLLLAQPAQLTAILVQAPVVLSALQVTILLPPVHAQHVL